MKHCALLALACLPFCLPLAGCYSTRPELVAPEALVSPYSIAAEPLWAVAPLRNDSGTSLAEPLMLGDALVARLNEVRGLTVLPMNRTLAAMRYLRMTEVATAEDAVALADALGVDAIVAGSLTAFDPYDPPKLGYSLGLYRSTRTRMAELASRPGRGADPKSIQTSPRELGAVAVAEATRPLIVVNDHLDAANHAVLMNVKRYAEGRHDAETSLGWRRYTASMELYQDFSAYWAAYRLLQEERLRQVRAGVAGDKLAGTGR